ncbi:MAG TPA: lipoyl synthase [Firmicutes bacterium]|jgi:lipoic acid synthetase|nr:lipoyl synthase [Bacillota bacterium]
MEQRKPAWLKVKVQANQGKNEVEHLLQELALPTVCQEARCPNLMECYSRKTATFLLLGQNCTRHCAFCNIGKGKPQPVAADEPTRVAQAVTTLKLKHMVLTSVTRDDLPDGGAHHFAAVIAAVKSLNPETTVEVLIPDFQGEAQSIAAVVAAEPDVINHNVETVPRLYPAVRPEADYDRSLALLALVKKLAPRILTKSGLMVGLGEKEAELEQVFRDLRASGCEALTVGQYLAPSRHHRPVTAYITPAQFARYEAYGKKLGFRHVAAGPFVRSSYRAAEALLDD